jgi:hypothetical protein
MQPDLRPKIWFLGLSLILAGAVGSAQARPAHAFECPRVQQGAVTASLTAADSEILKSEDRVDLATGINEVVDQLQLRQPGLSYAQVVNALVAAYCPIVADLPNLTDAQKHTRVTRFAALARQLTPANSLPPGSLVIATVPLSPDVYRRLSAQAGSANQTTARFMAKILTDAAGQ